MSYGYKWTENYLRAASYVDKILKARSRAIFRSSNPLPSSLPSLILGPPGRWPDDSAVEGQSCCAQSRGDSVGADRAVHGQEQPHVGGKHPCLEA